MEIKTVNCYRKRFIAGLGMLALIAASIFGATNFPAYAQAGAGDEIRAQVQPLVATGEGEDLVLTSNWQTLAPGEQHVYSFEYSGGEQPIRVSMTANPAGAAQFQVWTDALLTQLNDDPNLAPLAVGEPIAEGSEFSVWPSNAPEPQIYFITVRPQADATDSAQYLLNIASPGVVVPNATPVPPTETQAAVPVTATPTVTATEVVTGPEPITGAENVTIVPAATPDPLIAIVVAPALNVRAGPSTAYPVITTVPAGTQLTVLGRNEVNTWIFVRLPDGTEGWVTRSLTDYVSVAEAIITAEPLPTSTPLPGVTATPTPDTQVVVVAPPTPEALDGDWRMISEGETHWYTFQYRGGGLPVHVWMDVEPDKGAIFNILDRQTAQAVLAGFAPNVVNAIGRGTSNPVEPGYSFWRAEFPEADVLYVMVQWEGPGDVFYAIHAAGPGLSRPVPQ
jgi:SH3-like domain-containing protein